MTATTRTAHVPAVTLPTVAGASMCRTNTLVSAVTFAMVGTTPVVFIPARERAANG